MTIKPAAPIVVGVDGSPESLRALHWATEEARLRRRPLRIVHAFLWPLLRVPLGPSPSGPATGGLQHAAEQILSTAADRAREGAAALDISTDMPVRAPAPALIEASRDAALVVVGNRGIGGFTGLLVGSVGVQVAAHAACPVVVVRDGAADRGSGAFAGQVVVGVDGSELSRLAVGFAFEQASRRGLGVVAVHAFQWPQPTQPGDMLPLVYDVDELRSEETRLLAETLAGWSEKYPDVPVQPRVVQGHPAAVLVRESAGAALTVVGARGRGGFTGLLLGSVSQAVLHHAPCPVAIVRAH
ncbi:universal stress protein [Micromonospora orduensis]|uniref:Universal stress protein n=1 Tax=Micromonospora orduensis TaxID=1420891 RepID=A0A5C4QYI2_9ACTN|nr:universal stress protein [Micromonospora orduensis]TNH31128.1 universal stress protein [Micromonospora orduensis]